MTQEKEKKYFKKWFFRGAAIIFLIIFSFFLSLGYAFYNDPNKLLIEYSHQKSNFVHLGKGEIYEGEKVEGAITATENNLGIIAVRFETYGRKNTDSLIFRLKEKNENEWYYVNEYESRLFQGYPLFPFGFPIITHSKGKTYIFELESLRGKPGNAIAIEENEPIIVSKHKFSKEALLGNRDDLASFIQQKSLEIISSTTFLRVFGRLLFFSMAMFVLANIFLFWRRTIHLDISSKAAFVKIKEKSVRGKFYKGLKIVLAQKNVIFILFIGSAIRVFFLKTGNPPEEVVWQFLSPLSIAQILIALQKQWTPLFFDIASFFLLYRLATIHRMSGLKTGAFFFLHPLTFIISGIYGGMLNIIVFLLLVIVFILSKKDQIFSLQKKIMISFLIVFLFAIIISPMHEAQKEFVGIRAILFYLCPECDKSSFFTEIVYVVTFAIAGLLFYLSFPIKNLARLFLLLILSFLSFTPMFLFAYIWLPVAFGSLFRTKWYYFYSVVGFLSFFTKNIAVVFPFSPITINYVWFSLFLWFCAEVRETVSGVARTSDKFLEIVSTFIQKQKV